MDVGQPRSASTAEPVSELEAFPEWNAFCLAAGERVTVRQYKAAKALLEEARTQNYSPERLIEGICVLMANSFREGVNTTLELYGLKESS